MSVAPERVRVSSHIPRLDAFRAIAALLVIWEHFFAPLAPAGMAFYPGGLGVYFFFVLSGFLITESLERRTGSMRARLAGFYARRARRIFPVYYLMLAIGIALAIPGFRQSLPWSAVYLNNIQMLQTGQFQEYAGHFWTLAVEEQFYLLWPLLVVGLGRSATLVAAAGAVLVGVTYRFWGFDPALYPVYLVSPLANFDLLAMGGLLSFWLRKAGSGQVEARLRCLLPLSASAAMAFCFLSGVPMGPLRAVGVAILPTVAALFLAWMLARAVHARTAPPVWGERPLIGLGRISYGLYVYHLPLLYFVVQWEGGTPSVMARLAGLVATVMAAALSWHVLEAPILRRGRAASRIWPAGQDVAESGRP